MSDQRRIRSCISPFGISNLHYQSPHNIVWWSISFPGFGHMLLQQYFRGSILSILEVFLNYNAKLNLSMVYSFTGDYNQAAAVLNPKWALLYMFLYLFTIFDSYQLSISSNLISKIEKRTKLQTKSLAMNTFELTFLDKREPIIGLIWSLILPGTGQLYTQRFMLGFFGIIWWLVYSYYSNFYLGIYYLFLGDLQNATDVLNAQWLLFMPSVYGGAAYHAYTTCVEQNKLFKEEQRTYFNHTYQTSSLRLSKIR
ncbi:hypothetical protein EJF36_02710 [Bacillus sp. HMF5848]|uniref:hypothetical protein n=1 Tax=Bacillus sp. HMF5848 TaxID=2495421 RepID=UPI000F7850FD|nr:hypothetical protein [Bacillus sp. HMF5848]RSK25889.1 hypothetical protein EJF36_02710 [Bacillus sp. HMF5848]